MDLAIQGAIWLGAGVTLVMLLSRRRKRRAAALRSSAMRLAERRDAGGLPPALSCPSCRSKFCAGKQNRGRRLAVRPRRHRGPSRPSMPSWRCWRRANRAARRGLRWLRATSGRTAAGLRCAGVDQSTWVTALVALLPPEQLGARRARPRHRMAAGHHRRGIHRDCTGCASGCWASRVPRTGVSRLALDARHGRLGGSDLAGHAGAGKGGPPAALAGDPRDASMPAAGSC